MELRPTAVEFKHGKLVAGEVNYIFRANVANGAFEVGDLVSTADGKVWAKATEVALDGHYAVVAQAANLEAAGEVVCYKEGYFNENVLKVNGAEASADAKKILKTKNIFVTPVAE